MPDLTPRDSSALRLVCLEDNPLIALHLEHMVEDLGHQVVRTYESFSDLRSETAELAVDGALIDIDLADGRTGPEAAAWLRTRDIPAIFVTGQEHLASEYGDLVEAIVTKPLIEAALGRGLEKLVERTRRSPPRG